MASNPPDTEYSDSFSPSRRDPNSQNSFPSAGNHSMGSHPGTAVGTVLNLADHP